VGKRRGETQKSNQSNQNEFEEHHFIYVLLRLRQEADQTTAVEKELVWLVQTYNTIILRQEYIFLEKYVAIGHSRKSEFFESSFEIFESAEFKFTSILLLVLSCQVPIHFSSLN
jgi:hypothetical protein